MDGFFDGYAHENGVYYGGKEKLIAMRTGLIATQKGDNLLFFVLSPDDPRAPSATAPPSGSAGPSAQAIDSKGSSSPEPSPQAPAELTDVHPINALFADLQDIIKAHYTLYVPVRSKQGANAPSTANVRTQAYEAEQRKADNYMMGLISAIENSAPEGPSTNAGSLPDGVKQQMVELAAALGDQGKFAGIFAKHYMKQNTWPTFLDRIGDQLDPKYRRNNEAATVGMKRTRLDDDLVSEAPPSKHSRSMR
ncbi:hypothetical protein OH77DRAFT_1517991 [Trametes cingulata]|nr:hypothetical protein OH77DRAFT_1517991 [Trametes cingulata]